MQYFLQGKQIIFKDKSGQLKCSDIPTALYSASIPTEFVQTNKYNETVTAISKVLKANKNGTDKDTLFLNGRFYRQPGFVKALFDKVGKETQIKSEIDFVINSQKLESGNYSLIDIEELETTIYQIFVEEREYQITSKKSIETKKLIQSIGNALNIDPSKKNLLSNLFSYHNSISLNEFHKDSQLENMCYYGLQDEGLNTNLKELPCENLHSFFETISIAITAFIKESVSTTNKICVKSALINYLPMKVFAPSFGNTTLINELELLNNSTTQTSLKGNRLNENYELKCFSEVKRLELPFSYWIVSEADNLQIELVKKIGDNSQSIQINANSLKSELEKTFFNLNNKHLVKYLAEIKNDSCNNLHLRIQTLDKEEYYQLIND